MAGFEAPARSGPTLHRALPSRRERWGPGGSPGLQNQWRGARRGAVGSTPMRSRQWRADVDRESRRVPRASSACWRPSRPRVADGPEPRPRCVAAVARASSPRSGSAWRAGAAASGSTTLADAVARRLDGLADPEPAASSTVINATGVIVHTNLGRAPWPAAAIEAAARAAAATRLLELDRANGRRGPRFRVAEEHLIALTGAEDALVTNNNAAALALAVGLAGRRGVVVSRGELVEIGGGVRIPEIIARAGARLIEVGTTNRTRAADFEAPLADGRARVVLRVHPSNFRQTGFVETPDPAELATLAHAHDAIVIDDLGQRGAPRHGRVRAGPRTDARVNGWRPAPTSSLQRRQARRRPAGRSHRRSARPHRPAPAGPAGPGRPPRQGDARRRGGDARPLPRGPRAPTSRSGG